MTAWGALFTDDVDYVNRAGGWWRSNQENVDGHRLIHDALVRRNARPTLRAHVASISFLTDDIALVHVETSGPGPTPSGEMKELRGVMTVVMVKRAGTWFIRALQNTLVEPVPIPGQPRRP